MHGRGVDAGGNAALTNLRVIIPKSTTYRDLALETDAFRMEGTDIAEAV